MYERITFKANLTTPLEMVDFLQAEKDLEEASDEVADIIAPISNEDPTKPIHTAGFNIQKGSQNFRGNSSNCPSNRGSGFWGGSG